MSRLAAWHARLRSRSALAARAIHPLVRVLIALYSRCEFPRSIGLAEAALAAFPGAWPSHGDRRIQSKWHGFRLRLDISDYFQRLAWVVRAWPDTPTQVLLCRSLKPGDTFIDGGANIGAMSLMAAWRIGTKGLVHAFEPSPKALDRLRWHVEANGLSQVRIHAAGLSDEHATLALSLPREHNLGAATFSRVPDRYRESGAETSIARTLRLDDAELEIRGQLVVKLDIEGFELRALRGMESTLQTHRPLVITEVNPEMLEHADTSPRELAGFLIDRGYIPYGFTTRWRRRLILWPVPAGDLPVDVVWIRPESEGARRLSPFITQFP